MRFAIDDRVTFGRVWRWTRTNLQRDDGLLGYHWAGGRIADDEPAADADLDAARALVLAGERFGSAEYRDEGIRIGRALLSSEAAEVDGVPVLAAGPWAADDSPIVNPSYLSPRAYADLALPAPDERWDGLAASSRAIASALTAEGRTLPPDWASVGGMSSGSGGRISARAEPVTAPAGPSQTAGTKPASPSSGLDAARLAIRFAESCVPLDREVAAALWPRYANRPGLATYALDGRPAGKHTHAVSFVAAAAAAKADGDQERAEQLLDSAEAADSSQPTYYGSAWVALGRVMLTSSALGSCSP